jgi:hypothetical protein
LTLKLFLGEKAKSRVLISRPRHVVNSESNLVKKHENVAFEKLIILKSNSIEKGVELINKSWREDCDATLKFWCCMICKAWQSNYNMATYQ